MHPLMQYLIDDGAAVFQVGAYEIDVVVALNG
jgi:hypothetical protein